MKMVAFYLIAGGVLLVPVSLLLPNEFKVQLFILGTSALGFGFGLYVSTNMVNTGDNRGIGPSGNEEKKDGGPGGP